MRHREFWKLMEAEFGVPYARSLAADLVMAALGGRTAAQALESGEPPRDVWDAVCEAMSVPQERRRGAGPRASRGDVPPVLR